MDQPQLSGQKSKHNLISQKKYTHVEKTFEKRD